MLRPQSPRRSLKKPRCKHSYIAIVPSVYTQPNKSHFISFSLFRKESSPLYCRLIIATMLLCYVHDSCYPSFYLFFFFFFFLEDCWAWAHSSRRMILSSSPP